jgi:hypothetical protein
MLVALRAKAAKELWPNEMDASLLAASECAVNWTTLKLPFATGRFRCMPD